MEIANVTLFKTLLLCFIGITAYILSPYHFDFSLFGDQNILNILHNNINDTNFINECTNSINSYRVYYNTCCIHQFTFNYLDSLGYKDDPSHDGKFDKSMKNDKRSNRYNNETYACYSVDIIANSKRIREQIPIIYKTNLYTILNNYCQKSYDLNNQCNSFLPKTYDLNNTKERINFFTHLPCDNKPNNEWILKNDQHKGKGIRFINNSNYFRSIYLSKNESNCNIINDIRPNDEEKEYIHNAVAQEWIHNELEINNCKFSLRSFVVLANYENPLIVLYADSIIIKAMDPNSFMSNRDFSRKLHLNDTSTNYTGNIDDDDWVWNMKQFDEYFIDLNIKQLTEKIKNITRIIYLASFTQSKAINFNRFRHSYGLNLVQHYNLFAIDFIITQDFQIKLLEINSRPGSTWVPQNCYQSNELMDNHWGCIKGKQIAQEIINIQIEIATKKMNGQQIRTLQSIKHFKPVIWQ